MNEQLVNEVKAEYGRLLEQGNLSEALPLIRQAAHWADVEAQNLACDIYLHGAYGHVRSPKAGLVYAQMAALNGEPSAMNDLADLYASGDGCSRDEAKAFYWRNKAAQAGYGPSYDALGLAFLQGRQTQRDLKEARYWLEKAREFSDDERVNRHLHLLAKLEENEQF